MVSLPSIELAKLVVVTVPINPSIKWNFFYDMRKWIECSGIEWTVARLKSIYTDLVRVKAGLPPVSDYVAKKVNGSFKGSIGALFAIASRSEANFRSVVNLLRVYTVFVAPSFTDEQRRKYESGVLAKPVFVGRKYFSLIREGSKYLPSDLQKPVPRRLLDLGVSWGSNAPLLNNAYGASRMVYSRPAPQTVIDCVDSITWSPGNWTMFSKHKALYDQALLGLEGIRFMSYEPFGTWEPPKYWWRRPTLVGRISFNQEPGYKARTVSSPLLLHQAVMSGLEDVLFGILKELPWDCTFNQSKAFPAIQAALADGSMVYSCDLSSATDLFPLELQTYLLTCMGFNDYASLFEDLSRSEYMQPDGTLIKWTKGQPLGLRGSFPLFALTHGLCLLGLAGSYTNQFFILGDDIVILDADLYVKYRKMLNDFVCKVSEAKSLASRELAEFAGYLITSTGWYLPPKYKGITEDNVVRFLSVTGRRGYALLPAYLKREVDTRLASLPKSRGGLGWDNSDVPEEVRADLYDLECKGRFKAPSPQRDSMRKVQRLIYESKAISMALLKTSYQVDIEPMSDKDMRKEYAKMVQGTYAALASGSLPIGAIDANVNLLRLQRQMEIIPGDRAFHEVPTHPSKDAIKPVRRALRALTKVITRR